MQLTAYHDERGNIAALIARPDGAPPSHIELGRPGLRMTDIEAAEFTDDLDPEQVHERLSELIGTQQVEFGNSTARFTSRT
jgi:hypothetical protein